MFFIYLRRELRRRSRQAMVVAIGLAVGIALVMIVSATSAGVKKAQGQVLHSLYGVGTDITVTKTATPGSGGLRFGGFGGGAAGTRSAAAATRPAAGTQISRNVLRPTPGDGTLTTSDVVKIDRLHGTAAAAGGLQLTDTSFSGTIPSTSSRGAGTGTSTTAGAGSSGASFTINTFTVDGVQLTRSEVGPITGSEVTKGSYFPAKDATADVALISSSYASQQKLDVGSTLTVAGTSVSVIGIAKLGSGSADVFLPLGTAQTLASMSGDVTTVYVSAASASSVTSLASSIKSAVPGTTVSTSASLASEVTGSLKNATSLATSLGRWLSIAALIVAVLVAGLLMMAAVSRRVRELGTLKAIGWRTRRIVGQVMGEGLALGLLGGAIGIVLGIVGTEVVSAVSPGLTATVGSSLATSGASGFNGGGFNGGGFNGGGGSPRSSSATGGTTPAGGFHGGPFGRTAGGVHTVLVHLSAPLQGGTIAIAIALAVAGGLVAGAFGAWRAARLRPAVALRRVE